MATFVTPFSSLTKQWNVFITKIAELVNTVSVHGAQERLVIHCWLGVWTDACMVSDSLANSAYIYWGSLWRQTCCSVIDSKPQVKHAPAAKKVTWTRIKSIKNVTRCRDSRSAKSRETKGRDNSIKLFSMRPHPTYIYYCEKMCRLEL